ncbi:MAG: FimB/Mfa2 family fimbrial subunit [Alistipes sp.]|jgi:hypothetical protein|nr:FimB/Mfa2 family fimbrial subunit [Alistipes sp.]
MKRLLYILLPIISIVLLSSCIKEKYDDCERCTLTFSYLGDGTSDIFPEKITDVSLYVYDAAGVLVQTKHIEQNELKAFQGTKLNLSQGVYHVVGVGNSFSKTEINAPASTADLSDGYFNHPNAEKGGKIEGNDSLYLGRQTINVPNDWYEADVPFRSSHLKVSYTVKVKGANWMPMTRALTDGHFTLEVNNLTPLTDFENNTFGSATTYEPVLPLDTEDYIHKGYFNIMRHPKQNDVEFVLTENETGEVIHTLRLEDFLNEFPQIDVTKQEVLIPIVVELGYLGDICTDVTVTIPEWMIKDVTPGFGDN